MRLRIRGLRAAALSLLMACASAPPHAAARPPVQVGDATSFLRGTLRPWPVDAPAGVLAVTDPTTGRVATYDSALVILVLARSGRRAEAARVIEGLAALQSEDGGLPFSFTLPEPDRGQRYERSGAIAWVGYAAAEYLDADAGGPAREAALSLAHKAAGYLVARQVDRPGDPRDGLVRGGLGTLRYAIARGAIRETFIPGEIAWTSVEHNVDSFFFLRALARVTGTRAYADAADRIGAALAAHAWDAAEGQFVEGLGPDGPDDELALDCAAWGSVFLSAIGEDVRAARAFAAADARYASRDPGSGVRGHRPYAAGPLLPSEGLMRHFASSLAEPTWDRLPVVWPEGSAGVALAAWRTGHSERARAVLDALEPLRASDGSLPTSTADVPFVLDTRPSIAATAWVALVRGELERSPDRPTLWAP